MTLKEKFLNIEDSQSRYGGNLMFENEAKECEKIADDYAIEFAEWLRVNYYDNGELWTEWNSDDNTHSSEELLEIFKKEKGL